MRLNHRFVLPVAAVVLALGQFVHGQTTIITSPLDDIVGAAHDLNAHWSLPDFNYPGGEDPTKIIDGDILTKYLNFAGAGFNDDGLRVNSPTGFVITLSTKSPSPINGFRLATGNDAPSRDPATITIEGTNRPGSSENIVANDSDADWTMIYSGTSGLEIDQIRSTWGDWISFPTSATYKSYRVIITDLIRYPNNAPTNSQFGEIEMVYTVPEPASAGLLGVGALLAARRRRNARSA